MGPSERKTLLDRWMGRHSEAEEGRMKRAERMVHAAVDAHPAFDGYRDDIHVYAKGSYANRTTVPSDSDVDVVVENRDLFYYKYIPKSSAPAPDPYSNPYVGRWNDEAEWRAEVVAAMRNYFGVTEVDTSGKVAIRINEVPGSRPSADVVPSFELRRFDAPDRSVVHYGSRVYDTSGEAIDNYPAQQKKNGAAKDDRTSGRYRKFVRALKSAENFLVAESMLDDLPSYFMECLVYNVPDETITTGWTLDDGFRETLRFLILNLGDDVDDSTWWEPNGLKYLFRGHHKWSAQDGLKLAISTWIFLGYDRA